MVLPPSKPVTTALVKPYLKKLILQVHPDFFHRDVNKKQHNAQSLQQLYTLLNPILRPTATAASSTSYTHDSLRLSFYNKQQYQQKTKAAMAGVVFSEPNQVWPTIHSFFSLCQQLNVPVLPSDQDTVQTMIKQQQQQQQQQNQRSRQKKPSSLQQEFADAFYKQEQHKQQEQRKQKQKVEWTKSMVLDQPLFMCDPGLDADLIAAKLSQWLPQLHPEQWWGKIPTLYLSSQVSTPSDETTKGVLILNDAMSCRDIEQYLNQHLKKKINEYQDQ